MLNNTKGNQKRIGLKNNGYNMLGFKDITLGLMKKIVIIG